jgi:hypothetical protein
MLLLCCGATVVIVFMFMVLAMLLVTLMLRPPTAHAMHAHLLCPVQQGEPICRMSWLAHTQIASAS